jgi:putative transposase
LPLDEPHLWAAVRYVELNPVRSGIVTHAADYAWSSAAVHAGRAESSLLDPNRPFPGPIRDWSAWLALGLEEDTATRIRRHTARGIPTGDRRFRTEIEHRLGRGRGPTEQQDR